MQFIYFMIALFSSTIGAISGIGGGIIIKPALDSIGIIQPSTVSFLSGCTVLAMTLSALIRNRKSEVKLDLSISVYLAIGSAIGGILGKTLFSLIQSNVGLIQAVILLFINLGVFIYIINKTKIQTLSLTNTWYTILIGLILGLISAFLGIGGGPINIAILYYFFSMSPKQAARNSLFIILFSQITSLGSTFVTGSIPLFSAVTLFVMCIGGVSGAVIGSAISKKIKDQTVEYLFKWVLIGLILLNCYNILLFMRG